MRPSVPVLGMAGTVQSLDPSATDAVDISCSQCQNHVPGPNRLEDDIGDPVEIRDVRRPASSRGNGGDEVQSAHPRPLLLKEARERRNIQELHDSGS